MDKADNLIIGGGLAYTFLKAQGHEIGKSLVDNDKIELAKEFMEKAKEKGVNFYMPVDVVVTDEFSANCNNSNRWYRLLFLLIGKAWTSDRKHVKFMQM